MSSVPPIPRPVLPFEFPVPPPVVVRRPGIITAIGVLSIVIGSLSMLTSAVAGFYSIGFTAFAAASAKTATAARARSAAAATLNANAPTTQDIPEFVPDVLPAGPRGLDPDEREQIRQALATFRPLNPEKDHRLDQLLAKAGKDILPFVRLPSGRPTGNLNMPTVRNNVSDSGQLPSATGGDDGPIYFIVGTGKLEIYDDHAVFFPHGGGAPVRVARGVPDTESMTLAPADIEAVIARVTTLCAAGTNAGTITPQQLKVLRAELTGPSQKIIQIGPNDPPPAQQVFSASILPRGELNVAATGGFLSIDANGNILSSPSMPFVLPTINLRKEASVVTIVEALASIALGIYLLVIGILILRQVRASRRLHQVYALLKIPLAAVMAVGWTWFLTDVTTSFAPAGGNTPAASTGIVIGMIFAAVVSCAYPIGLLIAFRLRSVREYFDPPAGRW